MTGNLYVRVYCVLCFDSRFVSGSISDRTTEKAEKFPDGTDGGDTLDTCMLCACVILCHCFAMIWLAIYMLVCTICFDSGFVSGSIPDQRKQTSFLMEKTLWTCWIHVCAQNRNLRYCCAKCEKIRTQDLHLWFILFNFSFRQTFK